MLALKYLTGFSIAFAIVVCGTLESASAQEDGRRSGPPGFIRVQIMFALFDANQDNALSEEEVPGPVWNRMSEADTNEDGLATREEFKQLAASRLFGKFDENEDGALTEDEVPGPVWLRLSTADADEDGSVAMEEFLAAEPPRRGGPPSEGLR